MKNVIELLQNEQKKYEHYSSFPQDSPIYKDAKPTIGMLNTLSENSKKLAEEYKQAIDYLLQKNS